jgi:hypothetical protein
MVKRWHIRVMRSDIDVQGFAYGKLPIEAFLHFVRRRKLWPKGAGVHLKHFPDGHTYHAWPTFRACQGDMSPRDRWVAHITPEK